MIKVNIELPFSLNKARIGNRIRIRIRAYDVRIRIRMQEAKKNTDPAPYILSLLIFYTTFSQIEVFAKTFRENFSQKVLVKNFREKLTKFCENWHLS
jgi:hypothetical protein